MKIQDRVIRAARALLVNQETADADIAVQQALDEKVADRETNSLITAEVEQRIRETATNSLGGYGALQPYLDDPEIEEVWVNQPDELFYVRDGRVQKVSLQLSTEQIRTISFALLKDSGRRVDRVTPFADAALPDGSRLHIVVPDITAKHWSINLRKFPNKILGLSDLVKRKSLTVKQAKFLAEAVIDGKNILVSGATQAGKTTLLCALIAELPQTTRLVTCEETFEIRSELQDRVSMQTRQPNLEGQGEIPLRRLVKEALRMRPDRLVIGEVREAESFDLLIAMNSGLPGICTIHANSAQNALTKLCTLPLLAGPNITSDFVSATVIDCIDLIVHLENGPHGRRVKEICRVQSIDGTPRALEVRP